MMDFSSEVAEDSPVYFQSQKKIWRCYVYSESAEGHMQDSLIIALELNSRVSG